MMTPAKRHFQKIQAAQEAAKVAESGQRPDMNQHDLMQALLYEHRQQLKLIQSNDAKAEKKRELLPDYLPYVEGVLAAATGNQDDVLMYVMIWAIDAGDYETALNIATYALEHDLLPPDAFKRTTATLITEDLAEASLKADMPLQLLQRTADLVMDADMPDPVKGKLHKALGMHPDLQAQEPMTALNHLQSADNMISKSGVKTTIKQLQKQIKESTAPAVDEAQETAE